MFGPEGEQYNQYDGTRRTNQRWPFGTQLIQQDGRKFRFVLAGSSALVIGDCLTHAGNVANHVDLTSAIVALNARILTGTSGATAGTADQYYQGYAQVSVTPGGGDVYLLRDHDAWSSSGTYSVNLAAGHAVRTALTATSRVDLLKNPYDGVIQYPASIAGHCVGVAVEDIAASDFGWIQTHGECSILTAGTVVIGANVVADTATAGACGPATAATEEVIGVVRRVAASTAWSDIFLRVDG